MKTLMKWWRAESAVVLGVVLAVVGAGVVQGTWQRVLLAVLPLLGAGAVRQTVWAPDKVTSVVTGAATAVASQLTPDIVGATGQVTAAAQGVVDGVVAAAVGD